LPAFRPVDYRLLDEPMTNPVNRLERGGSVARKSTGGRECSSQILSGHAVSSGRSPSMRHRHRIVPL
jgi:hypothetical protein